MWRNALYYQFMDEKNFIYLAWWTINYIYIGLIGDSIAITWQAFLQVVQNENPFTQPFFNKKKKWI